MQFDENGKSRMELARGAVLNILESLKENSVALVVMGSPDQELPATPTTDLQQLAQKVMRMPEPTGQAQIRAGLLRAMDILDRGGTTARELYVVCDRQASTWNELKAGGDAFARAFRKRLNRSGTQTRFFVIPVGSDKSDNLSIESVELINPPAVRDQPAEFEVKVHNYGHTFKGNVDVRLEDKTATVSIAPDFSATVRLPMKFRGPASKVLRASLTGVGLKFDDEMKTAIDIIDPIKVLIVSGDERGMPLQNESDFLRIALAPKAAEARQKGDNSDNKARGDPCRVEVEAIEKWDEDKLRNYQVVVLANVAQLTDGQALALEQFVYEGGGLWIAPGSLTRVENYNEQLFRDGAGILPVKLLSATSEDGSEATTLQGITDFEHPMFRFLKGRPDPIPLVTIGRYFPVAARGRDASVLAQYSSGKPFLVESRAGRGRVLVMTTSVDADWGTLPLSNFYLPFVQSAARYLATGPAAERNLTPGRPIVAQFGPGADVKRAEIHLPSGEKKLLPVTRGEVRYSRTEQVGEYKVVVTDGTVPDWAKRGVSFVVRTPSVESDLTPVTEKRWKELAGELGFERINPERESVVAAVAAARGGRELWLSMVSVVIALGLIELVLVRRWSGEGM
jgi:hypothetical protein